MFERSATTLADAGLVEVAVVRRYDEPVEVRRGQVPVGARTGTGSTLLADTVEGPEQFLWRGRLWKVSEVLAHWVETGPWWSSRGARAALGADDSEGTDDTDDPTYDTGHDTDTDGDTGRRTGRTTPTDLVAEREVWRVEAGRGPRGQGAFDLVLDWADGTWRLSRCLD